MPAVAVVVAVSKVQADQGPVLAAVAMAAGGLAVLSQLRTDSQLDRPAEAECGADLVGTGDGQHVAQSPGAPSTAQVGVVAVALVTGAPACLDPGV